MFFEDFFRNEKMSKLTCYLTIRLIAHISAVPRGMHRMHGHSPHTFVSVVNGVLFRKCMPTTAYVFNGLEKSTNIQMEKSAKCK
jgi:hypothetical protein